MFGIRAQTTTWTGPEVVRIKVEKEALKKMKGNNNNRVSKEVPFIIGGKIDKILKKSFSSVEEMKPMWKDEFDNQLNKVVKQRQAKGVLIDYKKVFDIVDDLKLWYYFIVLEEQNLPDLMKELKALPDIEDVKLSPKRKSNFIPNDPLDVSSRNVRNYNEFHRFYEAWDISEGSSDIIIAIIDSGVLYTHEDLRNKLWVNPGEIANNGLDDDGNGFVDDIHGWDFLGSVDPLGNRATGDNDPSPVPSNTHGTTVAGIAAAEVNNMLGVAGSGYRSSIMITKHQADSLIGGYYFTSSGVLYATLNGADVINMSYGGAPPDSDEESIMAMAEALGVILVSAAGNENNSDESYPAAYPQVLSVANGYSPDGTRFIRWRSSSYGTWVDVSATGLIPHAVTATGDSNYESRGSIGTSFSSPVVAGLAALLRAENPSMSSMEIREIIKTTADGIDIYNPSYVGLLGSGSINAERALNKLLSGVTFSSGSDTLTYYTIPRYDASTYGLVSYSINNITKDILRNVMVELDGETGISIYHSSDMITKLLPNENYIFNSIISFNTGINPANSWRDHSLAFTAKVNYEGGVEISYNFDKDIGLASDVENDFLSTTFTSTGRLFRDGWSETDHRGLGFQLNRNGRYYDLSYLSGFMLASPLSNQVASSLITRDTLLGTTNLENDFIPLLGFQYDTLSQMGTASFQTDTSDFPGIHIDHKVRFGDETLLEQTVFLEYTLTNISSSSLDSIYSGIYMDWDVVSFRENNADFRSADSLFYVYYSGSQNIYIGMYVLSDDPTYFPIDPASPVSVIRGGRSYSFSVQDNDGYSDTDKITSLTTGLSHVPSYTDIDIRSVMGSGALDFELGEQHILHYAITIDSNLADLTSRTNAVKTYYQNLQREKEVNEPAENLFVRRCKQVAIDGANSIEDLICQTQVNRFSLAMDVNDGQEPSTFSNIQMSNKLIDWVLYDGDKDGDKDLFYAYADGLYWRRYESGIGFGLERGLYTSSINLLTIGQIRPSSIGGCIYDRDEVSDLFFRCFYFSEASPGDLEVVLLPEGSFGLESSYNGAEVYNILLLDQVDYGTKELGKDLADELVITTSLGIYSLANDTTGHYHQASSMVLDNPVGEIFSENQVAIKNEMLYVWIPGSGGSDVIKYKQIDSTTFEELSIPPLLDYEIEDIDSDGSNDLLLLDSERHLWWYINDGFNHYSTSSRIDLGVKEELLEGDRLGVGTDTSGLLLVNRFRYGVTSTSEISKEISRSVYGKYVPSYGEDEVGGWLMLGIPGYGSSTSNFRKDHLQGYITPENTIGRGALNLYYGYKDSTWLPHPATPGSTLPVVLSPGQGVIYFHFSVIGDKVELLGIEEAKGEVRVPLHGGWNLVGNPYSNIDGLSVSDFSNLIEKGDLESGTGYYWDEGGGTYMRVNGIVPVHKAFFILNKTDSTKASALLLNYDTSKKSVSDPSMETQVLFEMSLTYHSLDKERKYEDKALGYIFREDATLGEDFYDGDKLVPFWSYDEKGSYRSYLVGSLSDRGMGYISLPLKPDNPSKTPISHNWALINEGFSGNYRLSWSWSGLKEEEKVGYFRLHDRLLDVWVDSRQADGYEFVIEKDKNKQENTFFQSSSLWLGEIQESIQMDKQKLLYEKDHSRFVFHFTYSGSLANGIIPSDYTLLPNYPNPFNPATTIEFGLPSSSMVNLRVYNILGQEISTIVNNEPLPAGMHRYVWGSTTLSSGIYFYVLQAGPFYKVGRMTLIK